MAIAFVKNVGSNTALNSTTCAVTVPASGCAAGNLLAVRMYNASAAVTVSSIVDTGSNTYGEWVAKISGSDATLLWKSLLTTDLSSGNTITVTFSTMANCGVSVEEYSGVLNVEDGENTATGTSTTPSAAVTPTVPGLVLGNLGLSARPTFTQDSDSDNGDTWHDLTLVTINSAQDLRGGYKITTAAGTNTYNPTLGTSAEWFEQVGTLKAPASTFVPPNHPLMMTLSRR